MKIIKSENEKRLEKELREEWEIYNARKAVLAMSEEEVIEMMVKIFS